MPQLTSVWQRDRYFLCSGIIRVQNDSAGKIRMCPFKVPHVIVRIADPEMPNGVIPARFADRKQQRQRTVILSKVIISPCKLAGQVIAARRLRDGFDGVHDLLILALCVPVIQFGL